MTCFLYTHTTLPLNFLTIMTQWPFMTMTCLLYTHFTLPLHCVTMMTQVYTLHYTVIFSYKRIAEKWQWLVFYMHTSHFHSTPYDNNDTKCTHYTQLPYSTHVHQNDSKMTIKCGVRQNTWLSFDMHVLNMTVECGVYTCVIIVTRSWVEVWSVHIKNKSLSFFCHPFIRIEYDSFDSNGRRSSMQTDIGRTKHWKCECISISKL
jgi:hypothetical protein